MASKLSKKALPYLALSLLAGCDPVLLPLRPDVPQESLLQIEHKWYANVSRQGVVLKIRSHFYSYYVEGAYVKFPITITNTRTHPITLRHENLSVSINESAPMQESIELWLWPLNTEGDKWWEAHQVQALTIEPNSTVEVEIFLRANRVRSEWFPGKSITLHLDAFQDPITGERIPFAIRFLRQ